jgi:hypothetical protein
MDFLDLYETEARKSHRAWTHADTTNTRVGEMGKRRNAVSVQKEREDRTYPVNADLGGGEVSSFSRADSQRKPTEADVEQASNVSPAGTCRKERENVRNATFSADENQEPVENLMFYFMY